jgi:hypothetical protein
MGASELRIESETLASVATALTDARTALGADTDRFTGQSTACLGVSEVISRMAGLSLAHQGMIDAVDSALEQAATFPHDLGLQVDAQEAALAAKADGK